MKVLVTGSSGRVGRAIWIRLSREHDVRGFDRAPSSTAAFVGELDNAELLKRAVDGVDAIVHVAALHAPHVPYLDHTEFDRINVVGTERLLDAAERAGVRRIVYTSSTAVYGTAATPPERAGWVDEALTPEPETVYHRTKLEAEALLRDSAVNGGPQVRILRMSRCFPEPANVMAVFRLHRGVDARDVAAAHAAALVHEGDPCETFVISGDSPFLPEDVEGLWQDAPDILAMRAPGLVGAFAGRRWPLPRRIDRVYCAAAAMRHLRWRPRHGFDEILAQLDAESPEVLLPRDDCEAPAE